ncbi:MAG TPA: tRNA (cytidine(34)-2'-O)-methyltransferase [Erysipelotrichaceae bacterium]|nr:tRNA (cytidine(34)-2'-O)-methyltransferase [Erysipelotrichaceae bacterium]
MIHIVLFRPEKPQNTGNIMRLCVAIHATLHIIGPITFSLENKDLERAGMDYIQDLKMVFYEDYAEFKNKVPQDNIYYVTRYAKKVYSSYDLSNPVVDIYLMFGRESTGIPYDILRGNRDRLMRIPMVPEARSLNVANCVSLVAYEVLRQQNFPSLATEEMIKGPDFLFKNH